MPRKPPTEETARKGLAARAVLLEICTEHALHATFRPDKWKGDRLWVVALYGEVAVQEDKLGALKREILAEITDPCC